MGYVSQNLLPGEEIKHQGKIHWIVFIPHMVLMFVIIGFVTIIFRAIANSTTEMVVTSKRVIMKTGLISRNTFEMNLPKIETVGVDQSIWGRMLGYGTVVIVGSGGTKESFKWVANPLMFRKTVTELTI